MTQSNDYPTKQEIQAALQAAEIWDSRHAKTIRSILTLTPPQSPNHEPFRFYTKEDGACYTLLSADKDEVQFERNDGSVITYVRKSQSPNRAVLDALIEARDELNRRNSYDVQYKTTQVLVNVHKAIKDYEESK